MFWCPVFDWRTNHTIAINAEDHVIGHTFLGNVGADDVGYFITAYVFALKRFVF